MTRTDLLSLLPSNKADVRRANEIVALGFPVVEPLLPVLMEWMQDPDWPVARVLMPMMAGIGAPLAPHVSRVFASDNETLKAAVMAGIVAESAELRKIFNVEVASFGNVIAPRPGSEFGPPSAPGN